MAERKIRDIDQPKPGWANLCFNCVYLKEPQSDFEFPCKKVQFSPYNMVRIHGWTDVDVPTIDKRWPGSELVRYIVGSRHHRRILEECSSFKELNEDELREAQLSFINSPS